MGAPANDCRKVNRSYTTVCVNKSTISLVSSFTFFCDCIRLSLGPPNESTGPKRFVSGSRAGSREAMKERNHCPGQWLSNGRRTSQQQMRLKINIPVVFGVIFFAAFVFQLLPALAVLTGGDHNDIPAVVEMVERVARLGADTVNITFALEGQ